MLGLKCLVMSLFSSDFPNVVFQLMFWAKNKFARFNMFNRYFFDEHGESELTAFIQSCKKKTKLAIVLDPPFGGLVTTVGRSK